MGVQKVQQRFERVTIGASGFESVWVEVWLAGQEAVGTSSHRLGPGPGCLDGPEICRSMTESSSAQVLVVQ